jgi:hypothetical protein
MTQAAGLAVEVLHSAMFTSALTFPRSRRSRLPATTLGTTVRPEVPPPSLRQAPDGSTWQRLLFWLMAPAPRDAAPAANQLGAVRDDFHDSVLDLTVVPDAGELVRRIDAARSLREFWHLRAEVYRLVAVQYSQAEAERRLVPLNRHFPTRSPRSGFVPL